MIERRGLDWGGKKRVLSPGKEADGGENLTGGARLGPMDHHRAKRGYEKKEEMTMNSPRWNTKARDQRRRAAVAQNRWRRWSLGLGFAVARSEGGTGSRLR